MQCPIDQSELKLAERQGIEIDYCPQCRGVWLDRGELDKLIDRSLAAEPQGPPGYAEPSYGEHDGGKHGRAGYSPFRYGKRRK